MLWSIFVIYIITHHGLGGLSGLINGLIAAAIGAFSMLMSEPTAKNNVKRTRMFVLSIATLHYITLQMEAIVFIILQIFYAKCAVLKIGGYINNSLHLARKYARIFARGHYLFREANGFPRA